jgi:hypothetical protein
VATVFDNKAVLKYESVPRTVKQIIWTNFLTAIWKCDNNIFFWQKLPVTYFTVYQNSLMKGNMERATRRYEKLFFTMSNII